MNRSVLVAFFISLALSSDAMILKQSVFSSLNSPSDTIDLQTAKLAKTTFMAYDCKGCDQLLKTLVKNCSSLDLRTFAVGNKKNLKSKLRMLEKLKSKVYIGTSTQAYSDVGIDLMPYYISSKGERHESNIYTAMVEDGICKMKKKVKN
jgi:hypothetical protein